MDTTLDNYADYLAAFVRMRYKKRRITIVAISFGFVVATRMLQRYPDLAKRVDLVVSMVGFMHRDDFVYKPRKRWLMRMASGFFSLRPVSWIFRYVFLNGPIIRTVYASLPNGKRRLSSMNPIEARAMLDFDVGLWQLNDVSTHWRTTYEFLGLDNCRQQISLPVWHVGSKNDHYFNNDIVEQHMLVVFSSCTMLTMDAKAHTPSVTGNKAEMAIMLPSRLRRELSRQG
jgi:pimeloyl-ACP methyl ester carboxylesterase